LHRPRRKWSCDFGQPILAYRKVYNWANGGLDDLGLIGQFAIEVTHLYLEPEHADIRACELLVLRFGDERRVGAIAAQMRHQRAVAGRLLLHHGLQIDGRCGLQADTAQRVERVEIGGMASLHVAAAAAKQPIALDHRIERRMRPHVRRTRRHDVDVRLQDERTADLSAWAMDADDDRRGRMGFAEPAGAGMALERLAVHLETLHRQAPRAEGLEHEILDRVLRSSRRGEANEFLGVGDLLGEAGVDRGLDFFRQRGGEHNDCPACCICPSS
jgi:hypothetical protein